VSAEHEPPSTARVLGPARVRREHHALLTALAGGAPWPTALRVAASEISSAREAAPWLALAAAPDPTQVLAESRLLPPYLAAFLGPGEAAAPPLAARADAAREALRAWRGHSELTFGVRVLLLGALVGLAAHALLLVFVVPVFDMMYENSERPLHGAPLFVVALLLGLAALVQRLRDRPTTLARPSAWVGLAQLFLSTRRPLYRDEHTALSWLAAAERAKVPVNMLFSRLSQARPASALPRFAQAAAAATEAREALASWTRAGLLSPALARAGDGLLSAAVAQPYDRLARLARHAPLSRALDRERLLLALGTIALALGALSLVYGVYSAVFGLGGLVR
jgi:hypothetical protein